MCTHDLYSQELPEPLIHRIQSLLARKKSAETTLLSKSWRAAWSTRPTIDLDDSRVPHDPFSSSIKIDPLVNYAKKTFRRYEESDLRINAFTLCLHKEWYHISGLTTKWTLKALKLGATDLTFRCFGRYERIAIPLRELFGSERLVRLSLKNLTIDRPNVLINCRGLRSLVLIDSYISRDSLFHILSFCPLIENLSLSHIDSTSDDGDVNEYDEYEKLVLEKLTSLVMCLVEYDIQKSLLDSLLLSKFPNLKELTLKISSDQYDSLPYGEDREKQVVSSHSLEILNFGEDKDSYYYKSKEMPRFEFDFPSIRKFTFEGKYMPILYFRPTMDRWEESRVLLKLDSYDGFSARWFVKLSKFLAKLRMSKIHLCLHLDNPYIPDLEKYDYNEGEIEGLYAHEVEDLTINNERLPPLKFNSLLDGLFRICHPKTISRYVSSPADGNDDEKSDDGHNHNPENTRNNDVFLCKVIEQVMKVKNLMLPTQFMHGLTDLDEVIAEKLIDDVWEPQPMDSILDASAREQRRFRFQLKWKPSLHQYIAPPDDDDDDDDDDDEDYDYGD